MRTLTAFVQCAIIICRALFILEAIVNIIRVCPAYYPYFEHGGSVVADYELDKAIVSQGHSVDVMTCKSPSDDLEFNSISSEHSVSYFPALGNELYGVSFPALFKLFAVLRKGKKNVDVVWFGGVWNLLTILGPLICRLLSVKYIITPHGMLISRLIGLKSSRSKKAVIKMFLKSNLEHAFRVHFTVEKELHETEEATGASMNPVIFPLCFDLKRFDCDSLPVKNSAESDKIVLSFIGRITGKKRLDLVFKALQILPEETKNRLEFQIVGPDAEGLWDDQLYSLQRIGVSIKYFGPLYDADLVRAYHDSDIFILCSESENFAISVVEAAYCYSVPLITREVGVSEYFTDESAVYSELEHRDMSEKIEWLVENPEILARYKLSARKVSEQFDSGSLPENYFLNILV